MNIKAFLLKIDYLFSFSHFVSFLLVRGERWDRGEELQGSASSQKKILELIYLILNLI